MQHKKSQNWGGNMLNQFNQEEVKKILSKAVLVDSKYDLFGSDKHRYLLNPPIDAATVRETEAKYNFSLPDDYFRFITEIGDGGAGPDYGIYPFADFLKAGVGKFAEENAAAYRIEVAKPFAPRPMTVDDLNSDLGLTVSKQAYENNPSKFFIFEADEDGENIPCMDGFFVLGTSGCQYDFGVITTGEYRGQVFDTNNEGIYVFSAGSFTEFYQRWLDRISDTKGLLKGIKDLMARIARASKIVAPETLLSIRTGKLWTINKPGVGV